MHTQQSYSWGEVEKRSNWAKKQGHWTTTHMVINVAQAFRHETQVCSLSPDEKIKPHVQYFTLPNLLMYLRKPANIHPMWILDSPTQTQPFPRTTFYLGSSQRGGKNSKAKNKDPSVKLTLCTIDCASGPETCTNFCNSWKACSSPH
jgi:hypothetical protein